MSQYRIKIEGVTPYMQHRMDDKKLATWEKERSNIIERDDLADEPKKLAIFHSYVDETGNYFFPDSHLKQSFIEGGKYVKAKMGGTSRSMKTVVAAMWRIKEERIPFRKFDVVDSRSAVNKNVKARVMVHRPKWLEWSLEFTLLIDEEEKSRITEEIVKNIISYAGRYVGVGSYRPQHTGEFGRFQIASFEKIKEEKAA